MVRLLTLFGLTALLLTFVSFSFDGIVSNSAARRRRRAAPPSGGSEPAGQAVIAVLELPSGLAGAQPVPSGRGRWPRRARRALSWLLYLTIVVGAIVGIPSALSWALDSPNPIASVSGSSMWPTLHKGDIVLLQGVDGVEDLQVGDIIAFRQRQGFSIHRVVNIDGEKITTRGDGNFVNDQPINIDDVIGKVPKVRGRLARVPFLGNLSLILGPLMRQDTDFLSDENMARPVQDLAQLEGAATILGPIDDLSKQLADESEGSPGDSLPGIPVTDLRTVDQAPDTPVVTGSPIEDLTLAE